MYWQPDGARLVGNGTANGLADPPGRIRGELVAPTVFELVHCLHQADVALLNQIEELQSAIAVFLGDGNHQTQVGFDEFALGLLRIHVTLDHSALRALQIRERHSGLVLQPFYFEAMLPLRGTVAFLELVATRPRNLGFQLHPFPFKRTHDFNGFIHALDQSLALGVVQPQSPDDQRNMHHLAA